MSVRGLALLQQARYQAEALDNIVLALELAAEAHAASADDAEVRFHLRAFLRWAAGRLKRHHAIDRVLRRLALPDDLARLLTAIEDARQGRGPCGGNEGTSAQTLLLDADRSKQAFVARLELCPAPVGARGTAPPRCGAAFVEALARAEHLVMRLLAERGRFQPSSIVLEGQRFRVGGSLAAESYAKDGGSIGAAAAVVVHASLTGTPAPADIALTGGLDLEGRLVPVRGTTTKVRAALRERPLLRAVFVPAAAADLPGELRGDPRVRQVGKLTDLLEAVFGRDALAALPSAAVNVEGTVRLGIELYEKRSRLAAAQVVLETALAAIEERRRQRKDLSLHRREELLCRWRIGSAMIPLGDPEEAARHLEAGLALGAELFEAGDLEPQPYLGLRGTYAVLLRDGFRYQEAIALLEETLGLQRQLRVGKRELAKTLGNLGEVLTFTGEHERAEQLLREALAGLRAVYPDEVPRELCYLGNLQLRRGDPAAALGCFEEGLEANASVEYGRAMNERFLRYGVVRALAAGGRAAEAVAEADAAVARMPADSPYPRQLVLKHRGLALLSLGEQRAARQALQEAADPTFARGALLRFGVSTALAELAVHLLGSQDPADTEQAWPAARSFAAAALHVPGLPLSDAHRSTLEVVARGVAADSCGAADVIGALSASKGCFPY